MKTIQFSIFLLCFSPIFHFAQVKIGDNHETLNSNSLLELESATKGFLLPRLALTSTTSAAPMSSHVQGMLVFNTATAGSGNTAVSPGIYYNTGAQWERMDIASNNTPIATIISSANPATPSGYLYCNGQAVSRSTYASLFAIIGTTYGSGDGSTTFNLPDYRGYFLRGMNDASGVDPDAATRTNSGNGTSGDNLGTKQTDQVKAHTHTYYEVGSHNDPGSTVALYAAGGYSFKGSTRTSDSTGGNESRPKNIYVKYYIKF